MIITLTDEQQKEVLEKLGKEVKHVTFRLVAGIALLAEVADERDPLDGRY